MYDVHTFFFLENNNDAYMADKKNDYIFLQKILILMQTR